MQRTAVEHLDGLVTLWKEVFKDDDSFLVPFLKARQASADVYYTEKDGRIVSAVWYLGAEALINRSREDVRLIVGVATDSRYRKQGLMASLIESSRKNYTCPLVLYPAVRKYYEKNGFYSSSKAFTFTLEEKRLQTEDSWDIEVLDDIYTEAIKEKGGLLRDSYAWQAILEDHLLISTDGAYALYSPEEKHITEAAARSEESAEALLGKLGGRVTAIPGSAMEKILLEKKQPKEETLLGMCSENLDIYIAEQY